MMVKKQIMMVLIALSSFGMIAAQNLTGIEKGVGGSQSAISRDEQLIIDFIEPKIGPDEFILQALKRSVTMWRGSSDWQEKIKKNGSKQETCLSGYIGYDSDGSVNFKIYNHGGMISVEAEFETKSTTINPEGFNLKFIGGTNLSVQEGLLGPVLVCGKYAKCHYSVQVKRQIPSDYDRIINDIYNRPNCTSLNCQNPECLRLKQIRLDRDISRSIYHSLFGKNPKIEVIRKARCYAEFPIEVLLGK